MTFLDRAQLVGASQAAERYLVDELGLRQGRLYVNGRAMELEGPTFNAFQVCGTSERGLVHGGRGV